MSTDTEISNLEFRVVEAAVKRFQKERQDGFGYYDATTVAAINEEYHAVEALIAAREKAEAKEIEWASPQHYAQTIVPCPEPCNHVSCDLQRSAYREGKD